MESAGSGGPDVIVLGGGMAGVALCAALAGRLRVVLVEPEAQLGRHATGRSAAVFFESYGNAPVRALTRASRQFLTSPPPGFAPTPLADRRSCLWVAGGETRPALLPEGLRAVSLDEACAKVPILRADWLLGAVEDNSGYDLDVDALLQGYARLAKAAGVRFLTGAGEVMVERSRGGWRVRTACGEVLEARQVVNAAGAWADRVAEGAGVAPLGFAPLRRSALTLPAPKGHDMRDWPMVIEAQEQFYFKPDAGQLLLSPANEDPDHAGDAAPDELDVAIAVDRFEMATTCKVRRISHRWAGLRTFAPDRSPVVGAAPDAPGFFWLAGQGGYGIQTAPALSRLAAALLMDQPPPADLAEHGVDPADLSPTRATLHPAPARITA